MSHIRHADAHAARLTRMSEPTEAPRGARREVRRQAAAAAMMIRPAAFGWNAETRDSNRFQARTAPADPALQDSAVDEFDAMVAALQDAGVTIHAIEDRPEPRCPDALFPNNWVSFHDDGTVVLYPMLAPTRRRERRPDVLESLIQHGGYSVTRLLDLTHHELEQRFLEGTGSVVFDHVARIAYGCTSPRTHRGVLEELARELGYETCAFEASDRDGAAIYHTNVMLTIGTRFALVCSESISTGDRVRMLRRLEASGRAVVDIGFEALEAFAGNMLELQAADGASVLVVSERARAALPPDALDTLRSRVDRVVAPRIDRIEEAGGGSVRCMLAEVFLPVRPRRR